MRTLDESIHEIPAERGRPQRPARPFSRNPAAHRPRRHALTVVAASLGFALVQLDVSILNVALARIGEAIGTDVTGLQWVVDAYAIVFASLLLGAGALGDRLGARFAYNFGLALFALASLGCGLAPGIGMLIGARALQGIGAACLVPCSLALLSHACGDDAAARARAISWWTAAGSIALAAGPVIGGALVDLVGWRSIFLVNLPVAAAGIWLTRHVVADTPPRGGALDPMGQAFALVMLLALAGAVIEAGRFGVDTGPVLAGFTVAALCGGGFLIVERWDADPMLPLGFFRDPMFSAAVLVGLLINLTLYGVLFVLGLYLQQVRGYSPIEAGLAFLPFPVALGMANIAAGRVSVRAGIRLPMATGLLVAGLGYGMLSCLGTDSSYLALLPGLIIIPAGVGLAVPLMTTALLSTVPRSRSGVASGVLNTVRQAAGGVGVALFGALMAGRGVPGIQTAMLFSAVLMGCGALAAGFGMRRSAGKAS